MVSFAKKSQGPTLKNYHAIITQLEHYTLLKPLIKALPGPAAKLHLPAN